MTRLDSIGTPAPARHVLVVEDDIETRTYIAEGLEQTGWRVTTAGDGISGLRQATEAAFDVVIVDRMLPGLDGLLMVRGMRERRVETPIIFLTALGAIADRVAGLAEGDDYLVKPFSLVELNARIGALARRPALGTPERTVLEIGDVTLDRITRTVRRGGRPIDLLPMEYRLLEFLMLRRGQPFTRKMLLERVWGFNFDPRTNIVETHICRLRGKITPPGRRSIDYNQTRYGLPDRAIRTGAFLPLTQSYGSALPEEHGLRAKIQSTVRRADHAVSADGVRRFRRFFAHTGIRLVLIQSLVVTLSFLVAGYISQVVIARINREELRKTVQGEMVSMEAEYKGFGSTHVPSVVERRTRLWRGFDYRWTSPDGRSSVGALPAGSAQGWSNVRRGQADAPSGDDYYYVLTERLPDGATLSVGQNLFAARQETAEVTQALIASGVLGVIFCLGISYLFSRGTWRRIDALVLSARAVAAGQLSTRVPTHDGFASDDLDELGGAFNVMLDRLEELIRQVKQVSSDIAHDLRTPLSRVRQRLDKLRRSEDDAQARLRAINLIEANLDEVLSMFAALLRLAEIECEGPSGRDGPIDLSGLVQRMAETYTPDIETRGGALTVAVKPVAIRGDAGLITLAIANLLDNVLRHTPPDTAVRMCLEEKNGLAILSVSDGGPGVPEQYREMVLRRHWRLAPHRPGSSSGLGLAIVAAIARRHGARLTLTDTCPGLTVTLAFTVEPLS